MQKTRSCVTSSVLTPGPGGYAESTEPKLLTFPSGRAPLRAEENLFLSVRHFYRVKCDKRRSCKVSTVAYYYELQTQEGKEIISFHWHPEQRSSVTIPHLHIGSGAGAKIRQGFFKTHLPTPRMPLEDFLRILLEDFDIQPERDDWREVLQEGRAHYEEESTWG